MARIKRPKLDRQGPIRNWEAAVSTRPEPPGKDHASGTGPSAADVEDPIVRGVVSGGRVVDDWIRQAQRTARLFGGAAPTNLWTDAGGQMFKAMSDAVAAWWSLAGVLPNGYGGPARPSGVNHDAARQANGPSPEPMPTERQPNPRPAAVPSESSNGPRLRLDVASRQPIEVTVDLYKRGLTQYRVLDLRAADGEAPRIPGTRLEPWDSDGLRLYLVVPDAQPPGTYHAVVLDESADCVVGAVTLRIPTT